LVLEHQATLRCIIINAQLKVLDLQRQAIARLAYTLHQGQQFLLLMVHLVLLNFIFHQGAHQVLVLAMNQQMNCILLQELLLPLEVEVIHPVSCTHLHVVLLAMDMDLLAVMQQVCTSLQDQEVQTAMVLIQPTHCMFHLELGLHLGMERNHHLNYILLLVLLVRLDLEQNLQQDFTHLHAVLLEQEAEQQGMGQQDCIPLLGQLHQTDKERQARTELMFLQELPAHQQAEIQTHLDYTFLQELQRLQVLVLLETQLFTRTFVQLQEVDQQQYSMKLLDCTYRQERLKQTVSRVSLHQSIEQPEFQLPELAMEPIQHLVFMLPQETQPLLELEASRIQVSIPYQEMQMHLDHLHSLRSDCTPRQEVLLETAMDQQVVTRLVCMFLLEQEVQMEMEQNL
jgi:hypothetical protein